MKRLPFTQDAFRNEVPLNVTRERVFYAPTPHVESVVHSAVFGAKLYMTAKFCEA